MLRRGRSVSKFKKRGRGRRDLWIRRDRIEMEQWTARLLSNLFPVRLGSFSPEWDVNVKEKEKRNIFFLPPPSSFFVWRLSLEVVARRLRWSCLCPHRWKSNESFHRACLRHWEPVKPVVVGSYQTSPRLAICNGNQPLWAHTLEWSRAIRMRIESAEANLHLLYRPIRLCLNFISVACLNLLKNRTNLQFFWFGNVDSCRSERGLINFQQRLWGTATADMF